MQLSYAHLNLRHNPFGELTEDERVALSVVQVDDVVEMLKESRVVVQYVGDKGHGKTTHLLKIREAFSECGYVHIPEGERRPVPQGNPVLVDEAQRLTWWQRKRLFRQPRAIVLGTHRDFTFELQRAGREVETRQAGFQTSLPRLRELVERRIEYARRDAGTVPHVSDVDMKWLLQTHGHDIRSMLHVLYEAIQKMNDPGTVPVR